MTTNGQRGRHTTIKIYECKECQTQCETANSFRRHYKTHVYTKGTLSFNVISTASIHWKCLICNEMIVGDVKQHSQGHYMKICDICGKTFTRRHSWSEHMRRHKRRLSGIGYQCQICLKSFAQPAYLRSHVKLHSKSRQYVCDICGKSFKQSRHFNKHSLIHSDSKPLTCQFCGKGFTSSYNLKGHLRTHTGEKPFQCDLCDDAAFTHNVSLKTHKKSAHGIDMWKDQKSAVVEECQSSGMASGTTPATSSMAVAASPDKSPMETFVVSDGTETSSSSLEIRYREPFIQ